MNFTFWFSIVFFSCFWMVFSGRVLTLHRMGIKALTLSTKNGLKNFIMLILFMVILLIYTIVYIINAVVELDSILFMNLWKSSYSPYISVIGALLAFISLIVIIVAIHTMGSSWRIGIDRQTPDKLITGGIFNVSRNPIFLGMDGIVISLFIVQPTLLFMVFALLAPILIHVQILDEEKHLQALYGEEYINYKKTTKRYFLFF